MRRTAHTSMTPPQRSHGIHRAGTANGTWDHPARVLWTQPRRHVLPPLLLRSLVEGVVLFVSIVLIWGVGSVAHQWMTGQAALLQDRAAMQELTTTIRAMRFRAMTQHRLIELRINRVQRSFALMTVEEPPGGLIERVERTVWLPEGLSVLEGPAVLRALPNGQLSPASIVLVSPRLGVRFHVLTTQTGMVRLDEEAAL